MSFGWMNYIHWTLSLSVHFCRLWSLKRVICSVTVVLILFSTTSAVNNTFCTDLTPSTLTLEGVEVTHHMFGSEYNTLETLFSLEIEEIYEPVYKSECLKVCENNDSCRTEVRKKFLSQMGEHTRGSSVYIVERAQDYGNFTNYVNQRLSNWSPSTRSFFLTSCISMCYQMLTKLDDPKPFDCLCPNPCKHQHSCQVKDCHLYGVFEHQYFCKCQEDEVWDEELYLCISTSVNKLRTDVSMRISPSDPAACSSTAKCNPAGTLGCHQVVKMQLTTCICKAHFTGKRCEKLVNACESHIKHPHLPSGGLLVAGHKACNVNYNGNTCRSYISAEGDVYYRCKCNGSPWVPDPELAYDNCLKMHTMCDSTICVYGTCVTSSSGMHVSLCSF
ncbi:Acidic fibroblast growth factor intracellular binding protein [Paragonimus heterotremus]|uniref:Acidic fibroblast growth factor intracellular binding protein n=1 Tax=Paragonimus heterotremus TaxID=100268 RepID=A0A8J4T613_9TREM|nr:Acidic fibroblast growth factor intracellular binding protein [Paragonimus heterotremus]